MELRPKFSILILALTLLTILTAAGCKKIRPLSTIPRIESRPAEKQITRRVEAVLTEVASSERRWTGLAISKEGRVFVSYPRWSDDVSLSVGEILDSGKVVPYPDEEWNAWNASRTPGDHFVCVQSVHVDDEDNLWILDPASPDFKGVVPGGAKLLKVDLGREKVVERILFDEAVAPPASYLNDVRVDTKRDVAYITDSGLGALIVVDLKAGKSRRLLSDHPSTKSEDIVLKIAGREWLRDGQAPRVHADGLALDRDGKFLYYQALTARTLYRIETRWLLDPKLSQRELGAKVESMYETGAADGIEFGPDGYLYLTAIEDNAIKIFVSLGTVETVLEDELLKWPDSFASGPDGHMYFTTSQIHLGHDRSGPCRIFRFKPVK
jgi:sugar lactone lactonase YvrE